MFNNILLPLDGSEYGDKAVDLAIEIALKFNSSIAAVHVLNEFSYNNYADEEDSGDEILGNVTKKANDVGISVIEHLITGDPLRDMKTIIQKTNADLIVVPSLGKDTIKRKSYENQLGSVVDRILKTSDVPVLLVK